MRPYLYILSSGGNKIFIGMPTIPLNLFVLLYTSFSDASTLVAIAQPPLLV